MEAAARDDAPGRFDQRYPGLGLAFGAGQALSLP